MVRFKGVYLELMMRLMNVTATMRDIHKTSYLHIYIYIYIYTYNPIKNTNLSLVYKHRTYISIYRDVPCHFPHPPHPPQTHVHNYKPLT